VTLGAEHDTPLTFGEVSLELGSWQFTDTCGRHPADGWSGRQSKTRTTRPVRFPMLLPCAWRGSSDRPAKWAPWVIRQFADDISQYHARANALPRTVRSRSPRENTSVPAPSTLKYLTW